MLNYKNKMFFKYFDHELIQLSDSLLAINGQFTQIFYGQMIHELDLCTKEYMQKNKWLSRKLRHFTRWQIKKYMKMLSIFFVLHYEFQEHQFANPQLEHELFFLFRFSTNDIFYFYRLKRAIMTDYNVFLLHFVRNFQKIVHRLDKYHPFYFAQICFFLQHAYQNFFATFKEYMPKNIYAS